MKRLVEFPLEDGGVIIAEVEDNEPAGPRVRGVRPGELTEKATETFEKSLDKIKPVADSIITRMRQLATKPDQVAVEFGVKLSAAAGVMLASSALEANFKVTLSWKLEGKETKG